MPLSLLAIARKITGTRWSGPRFFGNAAGIFGVIEEAITDVDERKAVIERAASLASAWPGLAPHRKKSVLQALMHRIEMRRETIMLQLRGNRLAEIVDPDVDLPAVSSSGDAGPWLTLTLPAQRKRIGKETALLIDGKSRRQPDRNLLGLLAKAHIFHQMVMQGEGRSSTLRRDSGNRIYIITVSGTISDKVLKLRNGDFVIP